MSKKIKFLIPFLLVALIFIGASCGKDNNNYNSEEEEAGVRYNTYSNNEWGVEFKYPEDWTKEFENSTEENLSLGVNSPIIEEVGESSAGFLVIAHAPESGQLFDYAIQQSIDQLKASGILTAYSEKTIDSRRAYELIYSDSPNNPQTKQLHYFVDGGDTWYQLLYMAKYDFYNDYLDTAKNMVLSFRITN
jgi:hypothetical protein